MLANIKIIIDSKKMYSKNIFQFLLLFIDSNCSELCFSIRRRIILLF